MPRYFIDIHDGATHVKDTVGFDLPDPDAARARLVQIMRRVAEGFDPANDRHDYLGVVRDEARRVVFRAHLSLDIEAVGAP